MFDERIALKKTTWPNWHVAMLSDLVSQAMVAAKGDTFYGYLDACDLCREPQTELARVLEETRTAHQKQLNIVEAKKQQRAQEEARILAARLDDVRKGARLSFWVSLASPLCAPALGLAGLILGISACSRYRALPNKEGRQFAIAAIVISAIVFAAYALILFLVVIPANNR